MRALLMLTCTLAAVLVPTSRAGAQALTVVIEDGLVTIDAREVPLRAVLERWAAVGKVTLVNGGAIPSTPTTMLLSKVPERFALETLLRPISGYLLGERPDASAGTRIDRIMLMPSSGGAPVAFETYPRLPAAQSPQAPVTTFTQMPSPAVMVVGQSDAEVANAESPTAAVIGGPSGSAGFSTDGAEQVSNGTPSPVGQTSRRTRVTAVPVVDESEETGTPRPPTVPLTAEPPQAPPVEAGAADAKPSTIFGPTGGATPGTITPAPPKAP